ncbi:MAG: PaaI family thioesterase [Arenibacterium sp.]
MPPESASDRLIFGETGAQKLIGWVTDVGQPDGRARLYLDVTSEHTNRHGALHGGIIAMLLDSACGYTGSLHINPDTLPQMLSLSFTTQYLAPGGSGQVMAQGRVTGGGRKTLFIGGELLDNDGRLLATSTGVYKPVRQTAGD